jgi:hypothetical protein
LLAGEESPDCPPPLAFWRYGEQREEPHDA